MAPEEKIMVIWGLYQGPVCMETPMRGGEGASSSKASTMIQDGLCRRKVCVDWSLDGHEGLRVLP